VTRTRPLVVTAWLLGDVDDLHKLHSDPLTMRFRWAWETGDARGM
jgi:hypothetical protein